MREQKPTAVPRRLTGLVMLPLAALLSSCGGELLNPAGDIALQQRDIIFISTALMLLIIIPVMALTVVFAWRYRQSNTEATYDPDFDHSTALELVIWSAPLLIIIALGALTWWSTHLLDPFRPIDRVAAGKPVDPTVKPITVQVVSLDWKWLFIYPEQGVATVNELVLPVDVPVRFDITSTNMMNTFYAPTLAGMVYSMPGMRSQLHAVLNKPGTFEGMSANYSGAGFSDMRFKLYGVDSNGFGQWVGRVKASGRTLDTKTFIALEKPSEKVPPMYFAGAEADLFDRVVNRCVVPGTVCMSDMMDHTGGAAGRDGPPPHGHKPDGALFKHGDEMAPVPNITDPGKGPPPGSTQPDSPKNRDMSFTLPVALPASAGTVDA